jgi:hypothetical protein
LRSNAPRGFSSFLYHAPYVPKGASIMPRDFNTLSEMPQAVLGITCDLCQRRGEFEVGALKAQHGGDVKMPELLSRLVADCPRQRQRAFSVYDRCRAVYDKGSRYS